MALVISCVHSVPLGVTTGVSVFCCSVDADVYAYEVYSALHHFLMDDLCSPP